MPPKTDEHVGAPLVALGVKAASIHLACQIQGSEHAPTGLRGGMQGIKLEQDDSLATSVILPHLRVLSTRPEEMWVSRSHLHSLRTPPSISHSAEVHTPTAIQALRSCFGECCGRHSHTWTVAGAICGHGQCTAAGSGGAYLHSSGVA